jgi:hypothetical protein
MLMVFCRGLRAEDKALIVGGKALIFWTFGDFHKVVGLRGLGVLKGKVLKALICFCASREGSDVDRRAGMVVGRDGGGGAGVAGGLHGFLLLVRCARWRSHKRERMGGREGSRKVWEFFG